MQKPEKKVVKIEGNIKVCPKELLPEKAWIAYRDHNRVEQQIELPTQEIYQQGEYASHKSTTLNTILVEKALVARGIKYVSVIYDDKIHGVKITN